jgi:hypothetical protein
MYVNVREGGSYTDIQYWMFYPSNGPLTFRTGIFCNLSTQRRNYEWPDLGRHQGDWEHVTVRVIPAASGAFPGAGNTVEIAQGKVPQLDSIVVDTEHGSVFPCADAQLASYRRLMARFEAISLAPDPSRQYIREIADAL